MQTVASVLHDGCLPPANKSLWHLPQTSGCQVSGETASVAASGGILGRERRPREHRELSSRKDPERPDG